MTEILAKDHNLPASSIHKRNCSKNKDEHKTLTELKEKARKLKFRLLDTQNQNQVLRKELKIAKKVLSKEVPGIRGTDFRGSEEEAVCLRNKIVVLQKQIEELERPCEARKDAQNQGPDDKTKQETKPSNLPRRQSMAEKEMAGCMEVKNKLEYWKRRNAELVGMSEYLRLELDRLLEKAGDNRRIQSEYMGVEQELRANQAEKLDMRCKLDILKTKNHQLSEEVALLNEDIGRIRSKTDDDNMLVKALTSQQGNFQDLIERQQLLGEKDHRRFKEDLMEVQVKYTTSCNILEQLEETTTLKDYLLEDLRDCENANLNDEREDPKDNIEPEKASDDAEKLREPPSAGADPELSKERRKILSDFESAREEEKQLQEIAISNNKKLNDWLEQLRQAKATSAQKNAEIRSLEESIKILEGTSLGKTANSEASTSSMMDELSIKLAVELEIHRFMDICWYIVVASTCGMFNIYATGVDRMTKIFIDSLVESEKSSEKLSKAAENHAPSS